MKCRVECTSFAQTTMQISGEQGVGTAAPDVAVNATVHAGLPRHEQRYHALFKATNDILYQMSADWSEMQPLDGRGLVGSNDSPIKDWLQRNIPDEEHQRIRQAIAEAMESKSVFQLQHKVYRPDRSIGWTFSRAVPVLDSDGNILEWFGAAADVTERVEAEQALQKQRRLYESVLNNTPDLAYIFDLDHRFIYANEGLLKMWGKSWEEAVGQTCLELGYEPWHAEMHDREIEQVKATKQPIRGEVPFNGTFGRRIYDYIFTPVFGSDGEVVAVAGTTRDVTDYREKEDALRRSEERLEAAVEERTRELLDINEQLQGFTYSVAHDLRQQIRGINANASMLVLDAAEFLDEDCKQQLNHLVDSAKKLSVLVNDLLDYARLGTQEPTFVPVDLTKMAEEVAAYLTERGVFKAGSRVIVAPGLRTRADSAMLRIAVQNLLENAAKYSSLREAPLVEVGLENNTFFFRDNGIGFDMQFAPKLFQPFERLHLDSEYSGTGIGLAYVRRIVEKHGGSVWAKGEVDRGATFYVSLPHA